MVPTVGGTTYVADAIYNQAGIDQGIALNLLNAQPCTFTFAPGDIDLATDTTHGPIGVYTPGVYCISGAASFGSGITTLTGGGTYIFRMTGALTTAADTTVTLAEGASPCDVFWTPIEATTLGANSTFVGTNIDAAGITIGSTVNWFGRALAFGGTVSTDTDTFEMLICSSTLATLRIVKQVVNDNDGTAIPSLFNLHVKLSGTDVVGSPSVGTVTPGIAYSLYPGTYVVSEDANNSYSQSFSGDCASDGSVTLVAGEDKTCMIINNDIAPTNATLRIVKQVINDNSGTALPSSFNLHVKLLGTDVIGSPAVGTVLGTTYSLSPGTYMVSEDVNNSYSQSFSGDCASDGSVTLVAGESKTCTVINNDNGEILTSTGGFSIAGLILGSTMIIGSGFISRKKM